MRRLALILAVLAAALASAPAHAYRRLERRAVAWLRVALGCRRARRDVRGAHACAARRQADADGFTLQTRSPESPSWRRAAGRGLRPLADQQHRGRRYVYTSASCPCWRRAFTDDRALPLARRRRYGSRRRAASLHGLSPAGPAPDLSPARRPGASRRRPRACALRRPVVNRGHTLAGPISTSSSQSTARRAAGASASSRPASARSWRSRDRRAARARC